MFAYAYCCMPCLVGSNAEKLELGSSTKYCLCMFVPILNWIKIHEVYMAAKTKFGGENNLDGKVSDEVDGWLSAVCGGFCTQIQIAREFSGDMGETIERV